MLKIFDKFVNYIIERRRLKLMKTLDKMKSASFGNSTQKTHLTGNVTLTLSAENQEILHSIDEKIKNIIKPYLNNPEGLLPYIEDNGTKVYKFKNADKIMNLLKEERGFLPPFCGAKAFVLNLLVNLVCERKIEISTKTKPMFVLAENDMNIYFLLHQFHKWYSFKSGLAGFDEKSQKLFKQNFLPSNDEQMKKLSINEIILLKEAIARDTQAADFVIKISKENMGAKNALNKIINNGGAQL